MPYGECHETSKEKNEEALTFKWLPPPYGLTTLATEGNGVPGGGVFSYCNGKPA